MAVRLSDAGPKNARIVRPALAGNSCHTIRSQSKPCDLREILHSFIPNTLQRLQETNRNAQERAESLTCVSIAGPTKGISFGHEYGTRL